MGKIMMNDIQYGVGGIQKAEGITYDNSDSGMTATNVQGALDELSNGLANLIKYKTINPTVTVSAGGYQLISTWSALGITQGQVIGYVNTSGSALVTLQFASEGIYVFSDRVLSNNRGLTFKIYYI